MLRHQITEEVRMTLERGETLLVTFGIPLFLLVFFSKVNVINTGTVSRVDFIAPGIFCLAIMSTAMVSLGIATGFERSYGVLRRLGTTPLGRGGLIASKIISVIIIELIQCVVIGLVALLVGWHIHSGVGTAIGAEILGTIAFGGIGLLMAGSLRAELTLAAANGVYVVLLLIGGIVFPLAKLGAFASFARLLPAAALSDLLRPALSAHQSLPAEGWIVLACWAVVAPLLAANRIRFD